MILRVIDQPVAGIKDAFGVAVGTVKIDIALVPGAVLFIGQKAFVIAEAVSADALAGRHFPQISPAGDPSELLRLELGDVIARQTPELPDVFGHMILIRVFPLFRHGDPVRIRGR